MSECMPVCGLQRISHDFVFVNKFSKGVDYAWSSLQFIIAVYIIRRCLRPCSRRLHGPWLLMHVFRSFSKSAYSIRAGSNQLLDKLVLNWVPFVPPTEHVQVKLFGAEVVRKIGVAKTSNTDKTFKDANPAIVS